MSKAKEVFKTDWFSIEALAQKNQKPYYRLTTSDSIVIIPQTTSGKLVLIRQFRPAIGKHMLEWPAGQVDPGESPRHASQRELKEETGYVCKRLRFLGRFRVSPCRINSTVHLFYGSGAHLENKRAHGEKNIRVLLVDETKIDKLILSSGEFASVPVIGFYHFAKIKGLL